MKSTNWIDFEGQKYIVGAEERALDAMLRQGAPINFSCRKGTCRSCMMQAVSGDPGKAATESLPQEFVDLGLFLPCMASEIDSVVAQRPDLSLCTQVAVVAEKMQKTNDIVILRLEPASSISWQPGQVIGLMNDNGDMRSYSLVTGDADYFLEVHIRIYPHGAVSRWISKLSVGDTVRFQGPSGNFVYNDYMTDRPLLLVGTGTGGGVLTGIAQTATARGHRGPIHLCLGGRTVDDLYLGEHLDALSNSVTILQAASQEPFGDQAAARITDLVFQDLTDLSETEIFLCGNPDMIETARIAAMQRGADLARLHSDPFDPPEPYQTTESRKITSIDSDPEMWSALGNGEKLTEILTEFYTALFEDPRLSPFFHRTTKQRAIEKQYSFLQDLFHGTKLFFGEKPFNAHHWMVISDDLFDYRERLFFDVVRRHGIAEDLIHRWAGIHEMFRREIVKNAPRGILHKGVEVNLEGYSTETLDVGSVCNGCQEEVSPGDSVLMHIRTGEIFCAACEGKQKAQAA